MYSQAAQQRSEGQQTQQIAVYSKFSISVGNIYEAPIFSLKNILLSNFLIEQLIKETIDLVFTVQFLKGKDKLKNILELIAEMIHQSQHDRLTLQEYLQTYNIRKKIQQRKKSKEKNQSPLILSEQQAKMKGIFTMIDQFNEQTKIELEDILLNTQNQPDKIFFYLSKTLDELITKVKEHITKMYEDVQNSQEGQGKSKEEVADYLKNRIINAKEEKKKSNMGQVVKENFKNEDKNAFIAKLIMGKTINSNVNAESHQFNLKQALSTKKQSPKVTIDRMKSTEPQRNKKDIVNKIAQIKPLELELAKNPQIQREKKQIATKVQKKQVLPPPPQPPKQQRINSFMQALFGAVQKQTDKLPAENPPIESQIEENKKKQAQKQSKISTNKQFQRKRSIKQMLKSPKAQILLNRSPYH